MLCSVLGRAYNLMIVHIIVKYKSSKSMRLANKILLVLSVVSLCIINAYAETKTIDEIINMGIANNPKHKSLYMKVQSKTAEFKFSFTFDKANVSYGYDQVNIADNDYPLHTFTIGQSIEYPKYQMAGNVMGDMEIQLAATEYKLHKNQLIKDISSTYYEILSHELKANTLRRVDSLYNIAISSSAIKKLDELNLKAKKAKVQDAILSNSAALSIARRQLRLLINSEVDYEIAPQEQMAMEINPYNDTNSNVLYLRNLEQYYESIIDVEKYQSYPDFNIEYSLHTNPQPNNRLYSAIQVGVAIPILNSGQSAKVEAAEYALEAQKLLSDYESKKLSAKYFELSTKFALLKSVINEYFANRKQIKEALESEAINAMSNGEIDSYKLILSLDNATDIEQQYIDNITKFRQILTEINYLNN